MEAGKEEAVYLVPAVDKALCILDLLKSEGRELTISDVAKATGWHKSSVQKLLITLHHHGVVQRDEGTKRYSLGIALAEYGRAALNSLDIRKTARPFLNALVEYTGETAVLAILQGTKMVMVDKKEPPVQIRVSPFIGWRFPATATANGKALLAWLPERRVDELIRKGGLLVRTAKSFTDPIAYRAELAATRRRGYSVECEEFQEGVNGVAAPVFNSSRRVVAVLSSVGPTFRMTEEKMRDCGEKCVELAAELSRKLS